MIKEIEAYPGAIMFIDEIHTVIGAGATSGGAMDASNLLKPALAGGTIRCIGSTTYKEYRQYFEKDRALVRRFQKIDVNEPSIPDAIEIMKGLKPYFEAYHKLKYTNDAIKAAVELSARYIHDRKLPDKAIDVIDELGAAQMLLPESRRKKTIGIKEVETTIATMARIPPKTVSKDDAEVLQHLEQTLKTMVYGQDKAIEALAGVDQARARGPARAGKADRLLPVLRPDRRRQDRGGQAAGDQPRRAADPLRHVGVHGAPHRVAADRRAARLCRLRPGRPAHRRDRPASAQRAAARRDREGASRPVQRAAADHGSRQAHRPQRQAGRFPQRHPDHDDQCRRVRHGQGGLRLHPAEAGRRRHGSDQPAVRAGVPQPARRHRHLRPPVAGGDRQGGREVRAAARGAARRPQRDDRAVGGGEPLADRQRLRRADGRAADGARDPGAHQEGPRRRGAVRQAQGRRPRARRRGQGRERPRQARLRVPRRPGDAEAGEDSGEEGAQAAQAERRARSRPNGGGNGGPPRGGGTVPKVPLVKV